MPSLIVRQQHDVCPVVHVCDRLERPGHARPRPANTYHCVVGYWIIQGGFAAKLWKERAVPVGHEVPASYTRCKQQNKLIQATIRSTRDIEATCDIAIVNFAEYNAQYLVEFYILIFDLTKIIRSVWSVLVLCSYFVLLFKQCYNEQ